MAAARDGVRIINGGILVQRNQARAPVLMRERARPLINYAAALTSIFLG